MKVPTGKTSADRASGPTEPQSDSPRTNEKDRTLTRRTVKGAAGGLKGVHYEDDRRPGALERGARRADAEQRRVTSEQASRTFGAPSGGDKNTSAPSSRAGPLPESFAAPSPELRKSIFSAPSAPKEEAEMVLDDEDAVTRDMKARHRARQVVARDRFTVDKDAPEYRRAIRWDLLDDDDESMEGEESEVDLSAIAEAIASADDEEQSRAHLFEPGQNYARPGEPGLLNPAEAMARLGSPLAYAQHALLLSEAFRQATGATRAETLSYLAELFVALPDLAFARSALRELGPGTGIIEIYPLEVMAHLVEHYPGFLRKVSFGRFFEQSKDTDRIQLEPYRAFPLFLRPELLVRGFALVGGGRPGYRFEPAREEGSYRLVFGAVGRFEVLVSARAPQGGTLIEKLFVEVLGEGPEPLAPQVFPRDPAKVAGWPRPVVNWTPPVDEEDVPGEEPEASGLSRAERMARTELDALRGPKGETETYAFRGIVRNDEGARGSEAVRAEEAKFRARAGLETAETDAPDPWSDLLRIARASGAPSPAFEIAEDDEPLEEVPPVRAEPVSTSPESLYGPLDLGSVASESSLEDPTSDEESGVDSEPAPAPEPTSKSLRGRRPAAAPCAPPVALATRNRRRPVEEPKPLAPESPENTEPSVSVVEQLAVDPPATAEETKQTEDLPVAIPIQFSVVPRAPLDHELDEEGENEEG